MFTDSASEFVGYRADRRTRGIAVAVAMGITALIMLALIYLVAPYVVEKKPIPKVFGIAIAGEKEAIDAKQNANPQKRAAGNPRPHRAASRDRPTPRPPQPSPVPQPDPVTPPKVDVIWLNRRDFAAADIDRVPAPAPGTARTTQADAGGDGGRDDVALTGQRAPGGEPLYAAEWVTRPTDAQLSPYLPPGYAGEGWGLIACRTIPNYHVDDCQELGDFPRGSRLASAVRQAAWQFRVRPPRVGGKELVGAWVSIRIDYTRRARP